jgi:hypothetical protein
MQVFWRYSGRDDGVVPQHSACMSSCHASRQAQVFACMHARRVISHIIGMFPVVGRERGQGGKEEGRREVERCGSERERERDRKAGWGSFWGLQHPPSCTRSCLVDDIISMGNPLRVTRARRSCVCKGSQGLCAPSRCEKKRKSPPDSISCAISSTTSTLVSHSLRSLFVNASREAALTQTRARART